MALRGRAKLSVAQPVGALIEHLFGNRRLAGFEQRLDRANVGRFCVEPVGARL